MGRHRTEKEKHSMIQFYFVTVGMMMNDGGLCCRGARIPAPEGHKWKEIRHDNTVTWLASWNENVQNGTKYVMLGATSRVKASDVTHINLLFFLFIISATAGISLKPRDFHFFSKIFVVMLKTSDILLGSEYKREI